MEFKDKSIVILCQQDWGKMFISKHHYAVELAKLGNTVYFVNGPDQRRVLKNGEIKITASSYPGLFLVTHNLFFPYFLKFKARDIYNMLVKMHIRKILKKIGKPVDVVWSFDLSDTIPLRFFPKSSRKIFMPVDEPLDNNAIRSARGAEIIISVTPEIIEKYNVYSVPRYSINHGVSEDFINKNTGYTQHDPIRVGLSGNFLRPDIDRSTLLQIIERHPDIHFHFWGAVHNSHSNLLLSEDPLTSQFIEKLEKLPNVILHGAVESRLLAEELKEVDVYLICYDLQKDQSKGTNYHKILEYLGGGQVIVSNNVSTYKDYPQLVNMIKNRENNAELPALFDTVIKALDQFNNLEHRQQRIQFAREHLYPSQLKKIEALMN